MLRPCAIAVGLTLAVSAANGPQLAPGYGFRALAWAPGHAIAFGVAGAGTYVVNDDGSGLRRLTTLHDASVSWSPDGRTLLIGSDLKMFSVGSDGVIRKLGAGVSPVWSPDGAHIAFSGVYGKDGIFVVRADGAGKARVGRRIAADQSPDVTWSPDGRQLAYVSCSAPPASSSCAHEIGLHLYVTSVSGGRTRRVAPRAGAPQCPAWSSRGALGFDDGATDRTTVVLPGGRTRSYPPGGCPSWSPDGRRFAVATATGIELRNADGRGPVVLRLSTHATFSDPVWSPDGQRLAVLVLPDGSDDQRLYTLRLDGSGFRRIPLPRR